MSSSINNLASVDYHLNPEDVGVVANPAESLDRIKVLSVIHRWLRKPGLEQAKQLLFSAVLGDVSATSNTCTFRVEYAISRIIKGKINIPLNTPNLYDALQKKLTELFNDDSLLEFCICVNDEILEPQQVNDHFKLSAGGCIDLRVGPIIDEERKAAIKLVSKSALAWLNLSPRLKLDKAIVFIALRNNPLLFEFLPENFKNDKDIAIAMVTQCPQTIQYVSPDLPHYKEVVLTAVAKDFNAFPHASSDFQNNRSMALAAVSENGSVLQHLNEDFQIDEEIIRAAEEKGGGLNIMLSDLQRNKPFILLALKISPQIFKQASAQLQADPEVIEVAREVGAI